MTKIATIADIRELEKVPLERRKLPSSTYQMLRLAADRTPDSPALIFFVDACQFRHSRTIRYREFLQRVQQTANTLHALGLPSDGVVSCLLPNLPETLYCLWGGQAAGIVNPINPWLEPNQIAAILQAVEARILVTLAPVSQSDLWEKVDRIRDRLPSLKIILRVDPRRYLAAPKRWMARLGQLGEQRLRRVPGQRVLDFEREISARTSDRLVSGREIQPHELAAYFHTGGTTGIPKITPHTHLNDYSAQQN